MGDDITTSASGHSLHFILVAFVNTISEEGGGSGMLGSGWLFFQQNIICSPQGRSKVLGPGLAMDVVISHTPN